MVAWLGWWCYVFHWQSVFYRSTERCSHTFVALVLPRNRWVLEVGRFLVNPLPMDRWTLWDKGFHRCCFTDGPMDPLRQGVPPLLLYRWTDGPPEARSMVKLWLIFNRLTGGLPFCLLLVRPMVCHCICYSFDRWSFNNATWLLIDLWDRLTDLTYCTIRFKKNAFLECKKFQKLILTIRVGAFFINFINIIVFA